MDHWPEVQFFPCISVHCVEWTEDLVVVELKAP